MTMIDETKLVDDILDHLMKIKEIDVNYARHSAKIFQDTLYSWNYPRDENMNIIAKLKERINVHGAV